jgi:hypothetical protein
MIPEAGFDTVGVSNEFDETREASLIDLVETIDYSPAAGLTSASLDESLVEASDAQNNVQEEVERIQESLLAGADPSLIAEPAAAGASATQGNEGHEAVFVNYLNPEMIPEAGFDTVGVSNEFDETREASLIDLVETIDYSPAAGLTSATLDEDDLGLIQTEATDEAVNSIISAV